MAGRGKSCYNGRGKGVANEEGSDHDPFDDASLASDDEQASGERSALAGKHPRYSSMPPTKRARVDEGGSVSGSGGEDSVEEEEEEPGPPSAGGSDRSDRSDNGSRAVSEDGEEEDEAEEDEEQDEQGRGSNLMQEMQKLRTDQASKVQRIGELTTELEASSKSQEALREEIERQKRTIAAQTREITRLSIKAGETSPEGGPMEEGSEDAPTTTLAHVPGPTRSLLADAAHPDDFSIALLLPPEFFSASPPYSFKNTGFNFPHRVATSRAGTPQYIVEARLLVHVGIQLQHRIRGTKATEFDLPTKEPVNFKVELCYQNTNEVVKAADLKSPPPHLLSPPEGQIAEKRMLHGAIAWRFHCKFLSRNTKSPCNQEFYLRVRCTNPELLAFNLETITPPFLAVSREVKPKRASGPSGGS